MTARPLSTFQSEGWYRPAGARSEHYYRPDPADGFGLGTLAIVSLCGDWGSGGGIRPLLKPATRPADKACQRCEKLVKAQLLSPAGSPWFSESPDQSLPRSQA